MRLYILLHVDGAIEIGRDATSGKVGTPKERDGAWERADA